MISAEKNYNAEQVARWLDDAKINGAGKFGAGVHDGSAEEFHARRGW